MSKDTLLAASRAGRTSVQNFQPKTGIGRFDAAYDAGRRELNVSVRLSFEFLSKKEFERDTGNAKWQDLADGPAWTAGEEQAYRADFKSIVERSWSGQYKFACVKAGWTDLSASVNLVVDPMAPRAGCHYWVQVTKAPAGQDFRAMVASSPDWNGRFCDRDVQPEQAKRRDDAFGLFATGWLHKAITDTNCDFLPFDAGSKSLTATTSARLDAFADKARRFVTKDAVDAGLQIWVYAQTGANDRFVTASGRSKAISDYLKTRLSPFGDAVQTVTKFSAQPWIEKPLQDNLNLRTPLSAKDKQNRNFQGGMLFVKSFIHNSQKLSLSDAPSLPRNYIVAAHEFGHMLGLIDEYFGVQCDRMKNAIDQRADLLASPTVAKTADRTAAQQEGFAKLVEKSQVRGAAPIMGGTSTVTDSIMYAGNQILPAHYFTLWQALRKCTQSDLNFEDWTIQADNPRNAIHTLLQI